MSPRRSAGRLFLGVGSRRGLRFFRRQGDDNFVGLGVVERLAGPDHDGIGIGLEMPYAIAQAGILLVQVLDVALQLLVFCALLKPHIKAVLAIDDVPGEQERKREASKDLYRALEKGQFAVSKYLVDEAKSGL